MRVLKKFFSVVLIIIGCVTAWISGLSTLGIVVGTLFIIAGASLWVMSSQKNYNKAVDTAKMIEQIGNMKLEDLFRHFAEMETPLGKPWMGSVRMIKQPCMIYGPGKEEDFIYIYQKKGCFYVTFCESEYWLNVSEEEIEKHRYKPADSSTEKKNIVCYATDTIALVDEIYQCIEAYVHDSEEYRSLSHSQDTSIRYRFDEELNLLGQNFSLCEMDGKRIYDVKGTVPLKTFHIYEADTENEVFKVTKKLMHFMPHYEFYQGNSMIGTFEKKVDFMHDTFEMKTSDGVLQMRSIGAVFGENYIVKIDDKVIGTIADNLNLNLNNLIYDNYVININDEKYKLLMVALGVMAARELARDRDSILLDDNDGL